MYFQNNITSCIALTSILLYLELPWYIEENKCYLKNKFSHDEFSEEERPVYNDEAKLQDEHHQEWNRNLVVLQVGGHTTVSLLGL